VVLTYPHHKYSISLITSLGYLKSYPNLSMNILNIEIVKTQSPSVIGRADVHFDGFILKGFKIMRDKVTLKEYVTPPSYQSPHGWRPLFKTDNPEDWKAIQSRILSEFSSYLINESVEEVSNK
jgi:hypothetical protein